MFVASWRRMIYPLLGRCRALVAGAIVLRKCALKNTFPSTSPDSPSVVVPPRAIWRLVFNNQEIPEYLLGCNVPCCCLSGHMLRRKVKIDTCQNQSPESIQSTEDVPSSDFPFLVSLIPHPSPQMTSRP